MAQIINLGRVTGKDGLSISSIEATESTASGGANVVKITISDGAEYEFDVRNGKDGEDGAAGPNEVTTATDSGITGLLKGSGGKVAQAAAGTDYMAPPSTATALPASGTALAANTIYTVSAAVGTYAFTAPASGWAHGKFTTDSSASVSFAGTFMGNAPTINASKTYEFDVYNGVWAVSEVKSA